MEGTVVASGGPYIQANTVINTDVSLLADGCYDFFVYDAGGNGVCCTNGAGFARLSSGSVTITQGTDFGSILTAQFDVVSVGNSYQAVKTEFDVYPNPSADQIYVEFTTERDRDVTIKIVNQLGQEVYTNKTAAASDVMQKVMVNTSNWPSGIYMILLDNGSSKSSRKLSISK